MTQLAAFNAIVENYQANSIGSLKKYKAALRAAKDAINALNAEDRKLFAAYVGNQIKDQVCDFPQWVRKELYSAA